MLRTYTTLFFLGFLGVLQAQLTNNGGTITIQEGATLYVEGHVINTASGSISNDGTIEITGNLTNAATMTNLADSKVIFSGAGNSNVDAGGASFAEVVINKDAGQQVILVSDAIVTESIDFMGDDNLITLGDNNLTLSAPAVATGYDDNEYVYTNSTGELIKQGLTSFEFPVGNGSYNPVTLTEAGTADDKGVRVLPSPLTNGLTGTAISTDMVDAAWVVSESSIGGSDLTVTPQWSAADHLTGLDITDLGVARYNGASYDLTIADLGAAVGTDPYTATRTGFTELGVFVVGGDPALSYIAVSPKVFLAGPYNGTDMNDNLRAGGLIPLTEPYTAMPSFTHVGRGGNEAVAMITDLDGATTAENIVDWVFLELRDKTDNTNVLATRSALLQKNGNIVDTDRAAVKFAGVSSDDYYVVVRHRNHLGIMSAATPSLSASTTALDFTTLPTVFDAGHANEAMINISGTYCMWAGNINANNNIRWSGPANDKNVLLNSCLGGSKITVLFSQYDNCDINMNGNIRWSGPGNDKNILLNSALGGNKVAVLFQHL